MKVRIEPSPRELPAVRAAAEAALARVPRDVATDVLLALDEAVSNAIRHGSPGGHRVDVAVDVDAAGGWIEATVRDQGPSKWLPKVPDAVPSTEGTGGRGLWIILHLVDELRLQREDGGTCLILRRRCTFS